MSQYESNNYSVSREMRRAARLNSIRNTTTPFLERYQAQLREMKERGLADLIPAEYSQACKSLEQAFADLEADPENSMKISRMLGKNIYDMFQYSKVLREKNYEKRRQEQAAARAEQRRQRDEARMRIEAERKKQREEAERIKQERNAAAKMRAEQQLAEQKRRTMLKEEHIAFMDYVQSAIAEIMKDPITADFAESNAMALQSEYESLSKTSENHAALKQSFSNEFAALLKTSQEKAAVWKSKRMESGKKESVSQQIEANKEAMTAVSESEELKKLIDNLNSLKENVEAGRISCEAAETKINETMQQYSNLAEEEAVQRETAAAIKESIENAGFSITSEEEEDGYLKITGRRLSGTEAIFMIDAKGRMKYSFEGYEGSSCKNDIEQVIPRLMDIYGISFSNREIWQNPDMIGGSTLELPEEREDNV